MAAIVRFNTTGTIDAYNGSAYATSTIPFSAGVTYHFRMVINVPAKTFSAYVTPAGGSELTIGTSYDVDRSGAPATSINNFNC